MFETISKFLHEIIDSNSLKVKYSHLTDMLSSKEYMSIFAMFVSFLSESDIVLLCDFHKVKTHNESLS